MIALNRQNKALCVMKLSEGGTCSTIIDPKLVFQTALKLNASSIILAHNHPSGNLKPSAADIELTKKIRKAADLFDMQVLDHVILTSESFYSLADNGDI